MCFYSYYTSLSSAKHSEASWGEQDSFLAQMSQKEMFLIFSGIILDTVLVNSVTINDLPYESIFVL